MRKKKGQLFCLHAVVINNNNTQYVKGIHTMKKRLARQWKLEMEQDSHCPIGKRCQIGGWIATKKNQIKGTRIGPCP